MMDTSQQSSSRSGNDYSATLIGTVSELRMELQRTMTEIKTTKDQNRSLQANNQGIKEELLDTRKKYSEAYENYMATVIEKLEAERQNEAFMDRLKKQLLEKTNDFDLMRDKNSPQVNTSRYHFVCFISFFNHFYHSLHDLYHHNYHHYDIYYI
jgi:dsDNA-specific endonuclease/ATPase MutS2